MRAWWHRQDDKPMVVVTLLVVLTLGGCVALELASPASVGERSNLPPVDCSTAPADDLGTELCAEGGPVEPP